MTSERFHFIRNYFHELYTAIIPLDFEKYTLDINYDSRSSLSLHMNEIFGNITREALQIIATFDKDFKINYVDSIPLLFNYETI